MCVALGPSAQTGPNRSTIAPPSARSPLISKSPHFPSLITLSQFPVSMAGPSTRPKNKAQRPGTIVKEYSQQRRSKEELDADRKADAEKKKAAALVRSGKLSNLAEIQEHLRQCSTEALTAANLSGPGSANAQDDQQMLESPHELPSVATLQSDSDKLPDVADLLANPPTAASMPAPLATIHLPAQATPVAKATRKEKNSNSVRRHDIEAITMVRSICLFLKPRLSKSPNSGRQAAKKPKVSNAVQSKLPSALLPSWTPPASQPRPKHRSSTASKGVPLNVVASGRRAVVTTVEPRHTSQGSVTVTVLDAETSRPMPSDIDSRGDDAEIIPRRAGGRRRATNDVLPPGTRGLYNKKVVPRFFTLLGQRKNPWALQDTIGLADEINSLWCEIFTGPYHGRLGYIVRVNTRLYKLTMQHMYIWRSAFGDSAIEAVKQLWEDGRIVGQDERIACAEFALMKGDPYLYGEVTTAEQGNETVVIGNSARPLYTGG
ncbi:hypothetical protein C8Q72DRAFT_798615 [Fomitopsis betulina]|nr:hypothetical protein C8Q72DRAFT_798615 [Fomitopsis betulina]